MAVKEYLKLEDLSACKIAFELSNYVWGIVVRWDFFAKDTVGKQYVKATDSISANISEGFGRYFKKDKVNFYRYSYGSIKEAYDWTNKSKVRNLLKPNEYNHIHKQLSLLPKEVHELIDFTNEKLSV